MWSILAEGNGNPNIYGSGRMVSYNNIEAGGQSFHLAQIDRDSGAGKTVEYPALRSRRRGEGVAGDPLAGWQLVRPGDLRLCRGQWPLRHGRHVHPDVRWQRANAAVRVSQRSRPAGPCTRTPGSPSPSRSRPPMVRPGSSHLGETEGGWWKVRYTVNSGNDTTTWEVNLLGNPVHLVIPVGIDHRLGHDRTQQGGAKIRQPWLRDVTSSRASCRSSPHLRRNEAHDAAGTASPVSRVARAAQSITLSASDAARPPPKTSVRPSGDRPFRFPNDRTSCRRLPVRS